MMKTGFALCVLVGCGPPAAPLIDAAAHPDVAVAIDAPADTPVTATKSGMVSLSQGMNANQPKSSASAIFATGDPFGSPVGSDGPCKVTTGPAQKGFSAGIISVTGTLTALTLNPEDAAPNVSYTTFPTAPQALYNAGATLSFSAAGGADFPAFATTLTAPIALAGFTPPTALSRAGYTATWTAGTSTEVWIIMGAFNATFDSAFTLCKVPDTGSFTIPASTFALIPAGYNQAAIGVARTASVDVPTAAGHVLVVALSNVASGFIPLGS